MEISEKELLKQIKNISQQITQNSFAFMAEISNIKVPATITIQYRINNVIKQIKGKLQIDLQCLPMLIYQKILTSLEVNLFIVFYRYIKNSYFSYFLYF